MTYADQLIQFLDKNAFVLVLGVGGLFAGMFLYRKFLEEEKFTGTDIEERVRDSLKDLVLTLGTNVQTAVRYRLNILGAFRKGYHFKIVEEGEKDEDKGESWDAFVTRPRFKLFNPFNYIAWFIFDRIAGLGWFEDLFLVPSKYVERFDQIEINKEVDFRKLAGVYVIRDEKGTKVVQGEAVMSLLEDSLERFSNLVEFMNFLDVQFSQSIQNMKKEYELEDKKWSSRSRGAVESG